MDNRKITDKRFESGTFRKVLKKEMRAADLSVAGRARVDAALKAALEREKKVGGLRYGISSKHAEALEKFPTSKRYAGRFDPKLKLKPKELKVMKGSLDVFFKRKPVEPKVEPKEAPHASMTSSPARPDESARSGGPLVSSKTMSERSISPKKDEGSDTKSVP